LAYNLLPIILFSIISFSFAQTLPYEKLDSKIFEFLNSSNKEETAKQFGLFYQNGELRVLLVFCSKINSGEKERIYLTNRIKVEKESHQLVRALVPIEEIMNLAKNPSILFIQLPNSPLPLNSGGMR
jgi:hypothetical protein